MLVFVRVETIHGNYEHCCRDTFDDTARRRLIKTYLIYLLPEFSELCFPLCFETLL